MRRVALIRPNVYATLALLLASPSFSQQVGTVDLSSPSAPAATVQKPQDDALPEGCQNLLPGIIADGAVVREDQQPLEVEVKIVTITKDRLAVGSEGQAVIRLRNSGRQPIQIPWSTDPNTAETANSPSSQSWEVGSFEVLLRGQLDHDVLLINPPRALYGSQFSAGSILAIQPGEWIVATIRFKLEAQYRVSPEPWTEGKMQLLVRWNQVNRTRSIKDCKVSTGYFRWGYRQRNLPKTILLTKGNSNTNVN